jgi:hypothetical protein
VKSLLSFLLLGSWNPRWLSGLLGDLQLSCGDLPKLCGASVVITWGPPIKLWRSSQALWCLSGDSWEPPIELWRLLQACTGSVTALKCPIVVGSSILVGGLEEITVSLRAVWGALCLHTAPTEISTRKGVNFGIYHCLHVPRLFLYPSSFTYAIYFAIAFVLEVIYILLSHSCLSCLA